MSSFAHLDDLQLSPHFWLSEFVTSASAERAGLRNEPQAWQIRNLASVALMLENVRGLLGGVPISITSGYRSPAVNKLVGGANKSAHLRGLAADFIAPGYGTPHAIAQALARSHPFIDQIDQLIFEGTWVHLGLPEPGAKPRGDVLTARFVKGCPTTYLPGVQ